MALHQIKSDLFTSYVFLEDDIVSFVNLIKHRVYVGKSIIDNETGRSSCVCLQRSSRFETWHSLISRFVLYWENYMVAWLASLSAMSFIFPAAFYLLQSANNGNAKVYRLYMNLNISGLVHTYLALSKIKEALCASREAMRFMPQSAKALKLVGDVHASNSGGREKVTLSSLLFKIKTSRLLS